MLRLWPAAGSLLEVVQSCWLLGRWAEMDLGEHYPCLKVEDLQRSIEFYLKLNFRLIEDHRAENWAVLQHNNMALCLYQGHIERNLINFRGGDIEAIHSEASARGLEFSKPAERHPDGSWSAELRDPDGNVIYFNTFPEERERYLRTGRLIDD
jgi:catechol 2,3-dioxygenase-like lactoylglutathione lyase family enzyme